jgi:hypothetical protein
MAAYSVVLAARHLRAVATTVLLTTALSLQVGCSTREDRAFEEAVHPVLRMAVEVATALPAATGEPETLRENLAHFRAGVIALPAPRRRGLRYLAMRLNNIEVSLAFWVGARETERAWRNRTDPGYQIDAKAEFDASAKYMGDLRLLGVAERVVLGTSDVLDHLVEVEMPDTLRVGSSYTLQDIESQERFVREQIAAMR